MPDLFEGSRIAYLGYSGVIDSQAVTRIAGSLNGAINSAYDIIYLCLSSPGGYMGDGIYLYHHLRAIPKPVLIHNTGTIASVATTLFVGALHRVCSKHAVFMMHPVLASPISSTASTPLKSALDAAQIDEARTEAILRERTRIPEDVLAERKNRDIYLTADKALEYGLVSEIREFALPSGNQIFNI